MSTPTSTITETMAAPSAAHYSIVNWVADIAELATPDGIHWCDGSEAERQALIDGMVETGTLTPLNPAKRPHSYLARSHPSDVARVEARTFICSPRPHGVGPTNNWMHPDEMRNTLNSIFTGTMRGRTMYVMPFAMGPVGSPLTRYGVQVTDSPYVVVSTGTMTRMGTHVLDHISDTSWVPAVHSVGAPLAPGERSEPWPCNDTKYISHFPETREIWSYGSAYGGNAILAKKAFALRIASVIARDEGWLAEHMLLVRATNPEGRVFHVAAAFPSGCGKTNFAMLQPTLPGWKVETLGDDITWIAPGRDGALRAINPEAGFFGVAPGTGEDTNPSAVAMLKENVIFTNVALTDDGDVWWEDLTDEPPEHLIDWQGNDWTPQSDSRPDHPNARFTVAVEQCPTIADSWDDPEGVPLDAIILGGRRANNVPLVAQARSWEHGVFMGATLASERTAAAEGTLGELRRDPFAMLPFCGYHMADYWAHWLRVGRQLHMDQAEIPIFMVNWFRQDRDGRLLWPGFGENARALAWILSRVEGTVQAEPSLAGLVPITGDIDMEAAGVTPADAEELFAINRESWRTETQDIAQFFDTMRPHVPDALQVQLDVLAQRVGESPDRWTPSSAPR